MNLKKTVFLGVILLASIIYLFRVAMPAREREAKKDMAFVSLEVGEIEKIEFARRPVDASAAEAFTIVSNTPAQNVAMAKEATPAGSLDQNGESDIPSDPENVTGPSSLKGWEIASLKGAPLDTTVVSAMVTNLRGLKLGVPIEESALEKDFKVYGLDKPILTLVIRPRSGDFTELAFGKKNEYLGLRYVKVSGRPGVFLVDDAAFTTLNKSSVDVREKAPIKFADTDVRELSIQSAKGAVKVSQVAAGEWKILEPSQFEASTEAVGDLLRSIKDLRASEFLDGQQGSLAQFGLEKPTVSVSLSFREGISPNPMVVKVGQVSDPKDPATKTVHFTYSGAPSVLRTLSDPFAALEVDKDTLRDRRVFKFGTSDIARLQVSGDQVSTLELVSEGIEWKVNGKEGDAVFVEEVLDNLTALKVAEFSSAVADVGFDKPHLTFTITKKGDSKEVVVLTVGKQAQRPDGAAFYARVGESGEILLLKESVLRQVTPRFETLLAATPTPAPAATVDGAASAGE